MPQIITATKTEMEIIGDVELKEWMCVQVKHHKDVAVTIERFQRNVWSLHTYQVTGRDVWISHYLLFEKGK